MNVEKSLHEQNRFNNLSPCTNTYLKRIKYGNTKPYSRNAVTAYNPPVPVNINYMFETVFDFGDHDEAIPTPAVQNLQILRYSRVGGSTERVAHLFVMLCNDSGTLVYGRLPGLGSRGLGLRRVRRA